MLGAGLRVPPTGLTVRRMVEADHPTVAALCHEPPDALRGDGMLSLVAVYNGRLVAVLRGWAGYPLGRIEWFKYEMSAPPRQRYQGGHWLLIVFEQILQSVGVTGWTARTTMTNRTMTKSLIARGACVLPEPTTEFVKRWR